MINTFFSVFLTCFLFACLTSDVRDSKNMQMNDKVELVRDGLIEFRKIQVDSFSIMIPSNWDLIERKNDQTDFDFAAKGECNSKFCTNLIGIRYNTSYANDFNSFCVGWIEEAQLSQFGFKHNNTKIAYHPLFNVKLLEYSLQQNGVEITGLTFIIDIENAWWTLTFMSNFENSHQKDEFMKKTKKIIKSISISS